MLGGLLSGQSHGDDEVGRMSSGGQNAFSFCGLVNGASVGALLHQIISFDRL